VPETLTLLDEGPGHPASMRPVLPACVAQQGFEPARG
jgi:hypothetical protein